MLNFTMTTDKPCYACGEPGVTYINLSANAAGSVPSNMQPVCQAHVPGWYRSLTQYGLTAGPAWRDWPDKPGVWVMDFDDGHSEIRIVTDPGNEPSDRRWFGPIPTDPMRQ